MHVGCTKWALQFPPGVSKVYAQNMKIKESKCPGEKRDFQFQ